MAAVRFLSQSGSLSLEASGLQGVGGVDRGEPLQQRRTNPERLPEPDTAKNKSNGAKMQPRYRLKSRLVSRIVSV
jgi:hypothetical protein